MTNIFTFFPHFFLAFLSLSCASSPSLTPKAAPKIPPAPSNPHNIPDKCNLATRLLFEPLDLPIDKICHNNIDPNITYNTIHQLGSGSFGTAFLAENRFTHQKVVIKKFLPNHVTSNVEIMLLKSFNNNSHILGYYECYYYNNQLSLITEYLPGNTLEKALDLHYLNHPNQPIPDNIIAKITKNLLLALQDLHDHSIIHRDLKPLNIVFKGDDWSSDVKLIDFGISVILDDKIPFITGIAAGTWGYMAPEVWGLKSYNCSADIWSLASTISSMIVNRKPPPASSINIPSPNFKDNNIILPSPIIPPPPSPFIPFYSPLPTNPSSPPPSDLKVPLVNTLLDSNIISPPIQIPTLSPQLEDFLRLAGSIDPNSRPSAKSLLDHPFILLADN